MAALHAAGMPILAGTDANETPAAPASPAFGESLHDELAAARRRRAHARRGAGAATSVAAEHFGLPDRGRDRARAARRPRAARADPTVDIAATRSIRGVWIAGERVTGVA